MSLRAVPLACPYCGESSIEPIGDERGYYCSSCDRRFELKFLGLGEPTEEELSEPQPGGGS